MAMAVPKLLDSSITTSSLISTVILLKPSQFFVGADKAGNRYFTRKEELDGIMKEKRWVIFKGEEDPTVPVRSYVIDWMVGYRDYSQWTCSITSRRGQGGLCVLHTCCVQVIKLQYKINHHQFFL